MLIAAAAAQPISPPASAVGREVRTRISNQPHQRRHPPPISVPPEIFAVHRRRRLADVRCL